MYLNVVDPIKPPVLKGFLPPIFSQYGGWKGMVHWAYNIRLDHISGLFRPWEFTLRPRTYSM